jgi:hypothetical protein
VPQAELVGALLEEVDKLEAEFKATSTPTDMNGDM